MGVLLRAHGDPTDVEYDLSGIGRLAIMASILRLQWEQAACATLQMHALHQADPSDGHHVDLRGGVLRRGIQRQHLDPHGHSKRVTRPDNILVTGGDTKTCQEAVGEKETLRNRLSQILGRLRG